MKTMIIIIVVVLVAVVAAAVAAVVAVAAVAAAVAAAAVVVVLFVCLFVSQSSGFTPINGTRRKQEFRPPLLETQSVQMFCLLNLEQVRV